MTSLSVLVTTTSPHDDLAATRRSLSRQTDVTCEIVVIEDVASFRRALDEGNTAFVTVVRAGTVLFPGALRAMLDAVSGDPEIGMADAFWLPTDALGRVSRESARAHVAGLRRRPPPALIERQSIITNGSGALALPTFRREALRSAGTLSGVSLDDALRRAALSIVNRGGVRLVPQVLCARPVPRGGARRAWDGVRRRAQRVLRAARTAPIWGPILRWPRPYEILSAPFKRLSFNGLRIPPRRSVPSGAERIAYVLWRYPSRSETFIRREVQALRHAGVSLDVFALETDDPPIAPDPASPAGAVTYFGPEIHDVGRSSVLEWLRRRPWTVLRLWLFIVGHRYDGHVKTWWGDRDLLYLAGQLASVLAKHRITRVHSPWANHHAIVAFGASRLLGATFSVQARAYEIHRSTESKAVADRLRFAEFVITNSRYNERYLRDLPGVSGVPPVHVIYNGVDLARFPADGGDRAPGPCRLLAVGRLVEQKGFRYLLQACALLRDRGVSFRCEIIGAARESLDTVTRLELRMLLSELGLESTVCFLGAQPFSHVLDAYRRADVFVLPCVRARDGSHDITPNSLIEAMAMGLPVISTSSGAIAEIVDHDRDGLLVPPGDARALTAALERLIRDAALRRHLGGAARKKIEERFDIERNVTQRVALFKSRRAG